MNRYEFVVTVLQLLCGVMITLLCTWCGFTLFKNHQEGGAYFLGLISASPAAAVSGVSGYALGKMRSQKEDGTRSLATATATTSEGQTVTVGAADTASS